MPGKIRILVAKLANFFQFFSVFSERRSAYRSGVFRSAAPEVAPANFWERRSGIAPAFGAIARSAAPLRSAAPKACELEYFNSMTLNLQALTFLSFIHLKS